MLDTYLLKILMLVTIILSMLLLVTIFLYKYPKGGTSGVY